MRALLIAAFLIVPQLSYGLSESEACRQIPNENNILRGKVELKTFPESSVEVKVLILTTPLCVIVRGFGVRDVQEIQLVDSKKIVEISDEEITLKGRLFKGATEQHRTLALLNVVEVMGDL